MVYWKFLATEHNHLLEFPPEVFSSIVYNLPVSDIISLRFTCKLFRYLRIDEEAPNLKIIPKWKRPRHLYEQRILAHRRYELDYHRTNRPLRLLICNKCGKLKQSHSTSGFPDSASSLKPRVIRTRECISCRVHRVENLRIAATFITYINNEIMFACWLCSTARPLSDDGIELWAALSPEEVDEKLVADAAIVEHKFCKFCYHERMSKAIDEEEKLKDTDYSELVRALEKRFPRLGRLGATVKELEKVQKEERAQAEREMQKVIEEQKRKLKREEEERLAAEENERKIQAQMKEAKSCQELQATAGTQEDVAEMLANINADDFDDSDLDQDDDNNNPSAATAPSETKQELDLAKQMSAMGLDPSASLSSPQKNSAALPIEKEDEYGGLDDEDMPDFEAHISPKADDAKISHPPNTSAKPSTNAAAILETQDVLVLTGPPANHNTDHSMGDEDDDDDDDEFGGDFDMNDVDPDRVAAPVQPLAAAAPQTTAGWDMGLWTPKR